MATSTLTCLLASMIGRKSIKVSEVVDYLTKRVDPARTIRRLHALKRKPPGYSEDMTLLEKVEYGKRFIVSERLRDVRTRIYINYSRKDGDEYINMEDVEITLTEEGLIRQNEPVVWRELRKAVMQGYLKATVETINGERANL